MATRLSAACCEKFVSVNAVHVIYRLMRGCNRSQPHMELIKYSVSILLNLAKVNYLYLILPTSNIGLAVANWVYLAIFGGYVNESLSAFAYFSKHFNESFAIQIGQVLLYYLKVINLFIILNIRLLILSFYSKNMYISYFYDWS